MLARDDFLNRNGFQLTEGTYKNYVHRFRKTRKGVPQQAQPLSPATIPAVEASTRPRTFDFDPRGIPDLLK